MLMLSSERNRHLSSSTWHCCPSPSYPFHISSSRLKNYSSTTHAHAQTISSWSCGPNNPGNPTNYFSKAPRLQTFISLSLTLPEDAPLYLENSNEHHEKFSFLTYATLNSGIYLSTSSSSSSSLSSLSIDQDMMNDTLHLNASDTSDIDIPPSLSQFKSELSSAPTSIDPQALSLGMKSCQIDAHRLVIHNTYEVLSPHLHDTLEKVQSQSFASRLHPSPALGPECCPSLPHQPLYGMEIDLFQYRLPQLCSMVPFTLQLCSPESTAMNHYTCSLQLRTISSHRR